MRHISLFLLVFLANVVFAGHELVPIPKEGKSQTEVLPSLSRADLRPRVIYPTGILRVDEHFFRVAVSRIPKNMGDGHEDWYLMSFRIEDTIVCSITFFIEENDSIFKGILIDEGWRGQGLMKPFIKYWTLLARRYGYHLQTARLYKPLFTKVFSDFFFQPATLDHRVRIYPHDESGQLRVHPFGFMFRRQLLKSQNMMEVEDLDTPGQDVYVYTSYLLSPDNEAAFLQRIDPIRGDYFVFERTTAKAIF